MNVNFNLSNDKNAKFSKTFYVIVKKHIFHRNQYRNAVRDENMASREKHLIPIYSLMHCIDMTFINN